MPEFIQDDLNEAGQAPAMRLLVNAAARGDLVTYGELARHLNVELGLVGVTPHHVGGPVGSLMHNILRVKPDAPLINLLVVRGDNSMPGEGADSFLKKRYDLRGNIRNAKRASLVQAELNNARLFQGWSKIYAKLFGGKLPSEPAVQPTQYDDDGQADNPKFGSRGGLPESDEHKNLKNHILSNPSVLRAKLSVPKGRIEAPLLSGDKMDVEFIEGARRIGVEVKSVRSQDADLKRGIFQCVKYRAVMIAEAGVKAKYAQCTVYLVTENPLSSQLKSLAKRLDVPVRVVRVN